MSKKGGYRIIDFEGIRFVNSQQPVTVPGIYKAVTGTKMCVFSGLTFANIKYKDFVPVIVPYTSSGVRATATIPDSGEYISVTITSDDGVRVVRDDM